MAGAVTLPGDRACASDRAVLLMPGILWPSKDHRQGRSLRARLRWRYAPPWTVIFHGKTRTYREDGGEIGSPPGQLGLSVSPFTQTMN